MAMAWSNLPLRAKGLIVVALPMVALVISAILNNRVQFEKNDAEAWVKRTLDGRTEIRNVQTGLLSAESAVRYYALSGDKEGLHAYEAAGPAIEASLQRLQDLMRDNREQIQRMPLLRQLARKRLEELRELRGYYDFPEALPPLADILRDGRGAMDETLREFQVAYDALDHLLQDFTKRNDDRQATLQSVTTGIAAGGLLGGILGMILFTTGIARRAPVSKESGDPAEKSLPAAPEQAGNDELRRVVAQSEELKLAMERAQILVWELEPASGHIRYQSGSEGLGTDHCPPQMIPETVDAWISAVHPEDRIDVQQELDQTLAGGGPFQLEYRVTLRGGETRWMAARGQFLFVGEEKQQRLVGVLADVTDRRKAGEELERAKEALELQTRILQLVLEIMGDAVAVADENGKFLAFNPAAQQILGQGAFGGNLDRWSEHYGLFLPDMVTLYPSENLPLARAIRGESVDAEEVFLRRAGAPEGTWLSVTARPLWEEDDRLQGGVVVFRDVSMAKRSGEVVRLARWEAEHVNQAKSEFLSRMGHELQTPLNSILGFAQLLELAQLTEEQGDNLQHILKAGYRLLELVNEVLDLARIEAGQLGLSPEPVRVREALKDALDVIQPLAVHQNIHVRAEGAMRCERHVQADRQRLKQVLVNLLSNAVKFNRNGGSVAVSCEETAENMLRIEVTDTGSGIAADGLNRLFKPFERLGTGAGVEGAGLGLALSKRLVEAMGGTIGVKSSVGAGSRFFIELAMLEVPAERLEGERPAALIPAHGDSPAQQGTVLYIEDNLSNLRLMEHIMAHRPGVRLLSATQAQMGLDLAEFHRPDWILLDMQLSDLPGEEVLRRLRGNPQTQQIPVTVLSVDDTPGQIDRMIAAGAQDYLSKPLDVRKLLGLLEKAMRHGESHS